MLINMIHSEPKPADKANDTMAKYYIDYDNKKKDAKLKNLDWSEL